MYELLFGRRKYGSRSNKFSRRRRRSHTTKKKGSVKVCKKKVGDTTRTIYKNRSNGKTFYRKGGRKVYIKHTKKRRFSKRRDSKRHSKRSDSKRSGSKRRGSKRRGSKRRGSKRRGSKRRMSRRHSRRHRFGSFGHGSAPTLLQMQGPFPGV